MPKIGGKRKAAADKREAAKRGKMFPEQRLADVVSGSNVSDLTYQPTDEDEVNDDTDGGPMVESIEQSSSAKLEIVSDMSLRLWEYCLTYGCRGRIASGGVK